MRLDTVLKYSNVFYSGRAAYSGRELIAGAGYPPTPAIIAGVVEPRRTTPAIIAGVVPPRRTTPANIAGVVRDARNLVARPK